MKVHRYQAVLENDQTSSKKATEQKYQNRSNGRLEEVVVKIINKIRNH